MTRDLTTAELICERNVLRHLNPLAAIILEAELARRTGTLDQEGPSEADSFGLALSP